MQQIAPGVRINTSQLWQTNTGIISGPEGTILVDPGVFESEFEDVSSAAGDIAAGFCTHAHWDHVLWHRDLGESVPRYATPETVALIQKDRERILNNLTKTEDYLQSQGLSDGEQLWDRTQLFKETPIGWGSGTIAGMSVDVVPVPGHANGQAALVLPELGVCFSADTLSDIETPSVDEGSQSILIYLQSLDRLQKVIDRVDWIVPGHGAPADRAEAQRRLDADRRYLTALVPTVNQAKAGESGEEIAKRILAELDERRAQSELAWGMHLSNIRQLLSEREQQESNPPVRRSSRLILLDAANRVWMLRIDDPVRPRWILPGGGLEVGESWEQAALRELWEECAINDAPIGPMVATRERMAKINMALGPDGMERIPETWILGQERYFVVRLNGQQPESSNMFDYEAGDYTRQGWLSAEDIRQSYEQVYPIGLADLLDQLSRGEFPREPIVWED